MVDTIARRADKDKVTIRQQLNRLEGVLLSLASGHGSSGSTNATSSSEATASPANTGHAAAVWNNEGNFAVWEEAEPLEQCGLLHAALQELILGSGRGGVDVGSGIGGLSGDILELSKASLCNLPVPTIPPATATRKLDFPQCFSFDASSLPPFPTSRDLPCTSIISVSIASFLQTLNTIDMLIDLRVLAPEYQDFTRRVNAVDGRETPLDHVDPGWLATLFIVCGHGLHVVGHEDWDELLRTDDSLKGIEKADVIKRCVEISMSILLASGICFISVCLYEGGL
ncbi:hypothetical protein BT69DRAFT_57765 [Atractiella rhizophila]|nr:hypothetical protein BT69DRAFT_57765 [Atractiella rhizophila]